MFSKFIKIVIIVAIVALAIILILQNSTGVDVVITDGLKLTNINLGVVLIGSFILGVGVASLFAVYFSVINFFKIKKVEFEKKQKENFIKTIVQAREAFSEGNWQEAKAIWEGLKRKDTSRVLANIEISKSLEAEGNLKEALKVIDFARQASPNNSEVLFRASELNLALGNKTAALDNLALILSRKSNQKAALLARKLSEDLNKIEDAIEYNQKAIESGSLSDYQEAKERLEFKKLIKDFGSDSDVETIKKSLNKFLKKNPKNIDAIITLADLEKNTNNLDKAGELLYRASNINNSAQLWHLAIKLWIDSGNPDKALTTAKNALKSTTGRDRLNAELDLIRVYLTLNKLEDAKTHLDGFKNLTEEVEVEVDEEISRNYLTLRGLCLNRVGEDKEARKIWTKLSNSDFSIERITNDYNATNQAVEAPAPRLSTP